jgi:group I intron endonuclease
MKKIINNSEGQGSLPFQNAYPILNYFTTTLNLDKELKMNQELGTIYIATNLINGKQYVGQTVRLFKKRKQEHLEFLRPSDNKLLRRSLQKYGRENFKWIHFDWPVDDLDFPEVFWIATLKTQTPNGFNIESGGNKNKRMHVSTKLKIGKANSNKHPSEEAKNKNAEAHMGKKHTKETKIKMSNMRKGNKHPLWGKHPTEETKIKMSISHKGKHPTEETRIKMSKAQQGVNNGFFGKQHTKETREKISKKRKER